MSSRQSRGKVVGGTDGRLSLAVCSLPIGGTVANFFNAAAAYSASRSAYGALHRRRRRGRTKPTYPAGPDHTFSLDTFLRCGANRSMSRTTMPRTFACVAYGVWFGGGGHHATITRCAGA